MRCNGHIINLAAQSFLFNTETEALAEHNNEGQYSTPTQLEMDSWRKKGPLGKLHNLIVYIRRSTQRIQRFRTQTGGLNLIRDNSTRWNSWFKMIDCALDPLRREAIDVFAARDKLEKDALSETDWGYLQKIRDFLQYFEDATLSTEGHVGTLDRVLPTMDFLLEHFEAAKIQYQEDRYMAPCCNSGWAKLDKYYALTGRTPVYIAATVLCPAFKWEYFESTWEDVWITRGKVKMQEFWEEKYKSKAIVLPPRANTATTVQHQQRENQYQAWRRKKAGVQTEVDEYARYLQAPILSEVKDALAWWLEPTQRLMYPNLSLMAIDILSIPAMSAEPERLFSGALLTVTDRRNNLEAETIEATECLKSWM